MNEHERISATGYVLIKNVIPKESCQSLVNACETAFDHDNDSERARSSRGHVYAARNVLDVVPMVHSVWQTGKLDRVLTLVLGNHYGLVRVLFFDKPPDRTWSLPWHKDTAIAVQDNTLPSTEFSRPTVKAGVPHVVASDRVLQRMLTMRLHLDDVTDENGPLRVVPGSHVSGTSDGVGADHAVTVHAQAGDVLAMRPLISHCSGASSETTTRHRRILHLEFAADPILSDGFQWHTFIRPFSDIPHND
ncbi:phytanoyl-CoA dioxygenase family protein [Stieleria varia]|uniref:Phytanoyl-CoA dioxygenase (PhyH) n=1 Tax=Stieleria varia TaxID=2528005 RepID=A0A5C6ANU1_9BACT|nr:phytanoyl-CoA dioxygenase family protein [Stieleria varia]TWU01101.1 Phytanoyl-CoA dioxygenase (PhyH) [Stieleria varia]